MCQPLCFTKCSMWRNIGTLLSVLPEPMRTSLCRARVMATLMRRQSASSRPAEWSALLRTKLTTMQSLSRPCRSSHAQVRLAGDDYVMLYEPQSTLMQ